jgi:hypothetical protein
MCGCYHTYFFERRDGFRTRVRAIFLESAPSLVRKPALNVSPEESMNSKWLALLIFPAIAHVAHAGTIDLMATIDGTQGPWTFSSSLISSFEYGTDSELAPTAITASDGFNFAAGGTFAITLERKGVRGGAASLSPMLSEIRLFPWTTVLEVAERFFPAFS